MTTQEILEKAKKAKAAMACCSSEQKDAALRAMAGQLILCTDEILRANAQDMERAKGSITETMLDRLRLTKERIAGMADGMLQVAALEDPVGEIISTVERPNGMRIEKVSVPMGVISIIYESRPNVTSDAAALALKAGSSCILRCGKEAHESAMEIVKALKKGMKEAGLPEDALFLIEDTTRASANELMTARGYVDLLIPRGGKGLIRSCVDNATVPVIETGNGICHIYVDETADQEMALNILENAKCSRPSVCNAAEVCLVNEKIAAEFLPKFQKRMVLERAERGVQPVELRLDEKAGKIIEGKVAGELDFDTEFLDYIMAVRTVANVDEAIAHIALHSTGHSEAIITRCDEAAKKFVAGIDSAAVYVNCSTRFTDGGEFGLGCEMGISTQKLHARGPMGLRELCSSKFVIHGDGQIR